MAVHNLPVELYTLVWNEWARPITVMPAAGGSYGARGYFDTFEIDVPGEGDTVYSDQRTILDLLNKEFTTLPGTGDQVNIIADPVSGAPAMGLYAIIDTDPYGTDVTTLTLRKVDVARP
jgi:hypothetical protein